MATLYCHTPAGIANVPIQFPEPPSSARWVLAQSGIQSPEQPSSLWNSPGSVTEVMANALPAASRSAAPVASTATRKRVEASNMVILQVGVHNGGRRRVPES